MTPYKPQACDLHQNYKLDSLNNFKDLNILSKTDDVRNNVTNTLDTDVFNQENQDYCNQRNQQYWLHIQWWSRTSHPRIGI